MTFDSVYHTAPAAAEEIRQRRLDPSLRQAVEEALGDGMPLALRGNEPRILHCPQVASPNTWMHHVELAGAATGLKPLYFEYHRDRFYPGNQTKLHLLHLRFFRGYDRNGLPRTKRMAVADVNQAAGHRFSEIHTHTGLGLVEFHNDLTAAVFPNAERHEMSGWIKTWPNPSALYEACLSLCLAHCVLFETFRIDGTDREFTERIFLPAFERVSKRFGCQPLIVPLESPDAPPDLYWYSYPEAIRPLVMERLSRSLPTHQRVPAAVA